MLKTTLTPAGYVVVDDDAMFEASAGRLRLTDLGYVQDRAETVNAHQLYIDQVKLGTTVRAYLTPLGYVACDYAVNVHVPGFDKAAAVAEEARNSVTLEKIRGYLPADFPE